MQKIAAYGKTTECNYDAICSRDEIPTLDYLKTKLKEEEAKQQDRDANTHFDNTERMRL